MTKNSESERGSEGEEELSEHASSEDEADAEDGNMSDQEGQEGEEEEDAASAEQLEERRQANVSALLSGSLTVTRKPLLPRLLSVQNAEAILRRPFQSPHPNAVTGPSEALRRKLLARRQFVPWGTGTIAPLKLSSPKPPPAPEERATTAVEKVELPPGVEPLVLWEPPAEEGGGGEVGPIVVDDMLTQWLRPHQREGVQFMFECVCGRRKFDGQGCILADDMGLGKTLQGITLLWTLLNSGHRLLGGRPVARRVIICCPTSLVSNWDSECVKFLKGRVRTLPLCESSREDVISSINQFLSPRSYHQVLIVSYETFRLHTERFCKEDSCDLLICDEAHRLKNDQTLTNKALGSLACKRRVLLSGTPLQNHLDEFYAMVSFCNPGVLGSPSQFRKHFELPILAGREPGSSDEQVQLGAERSAELSAIVNEFILRRTNSLLSAHLPPKVIEVVCCRMTPLQYELYCHFLQSKATKSLFSSQKAARVLSAITSLRKLLNHPKLIYDTLHSQAHSEEAGAHGFEDCGRFFPPGMFDAGRAGRGGMMIGWECLSGKFAVLARMLEILRATTKERTVVVSNYTQTLDLVAQLCREKGYPFLRLDGSTTITKRHKLVKKFNDPADDQFVFLLSSKAGGCGLNLIGGNRLVLFDPDWNPATDKQAAARVWRDGQKRKVFVYRFLTTGTIEEKVYQRQLSKEGLQQVFNSKGGASGPNLMSAEELRDLFSYDPDTLSNTYESMCKDSHGDEGSGGGDKGAAAGIAAEQQQQQQQAEGGGGGAGSSRSMIFKAQVGKPAEEDLQSWGHHSTMDTVPDAVMQQIGGEHVSFVFSCQVEGKPIEPELSQGQQQGKHSASEVQPRLGVGRRGPGGSGASGSRLQAQPSKLQAQPLQQPLGVSTVSADPGNSGIGGNRQNLSGAWPAPAQGPVQAAPAVVAAAAAPQTARLAAAAEQSQQQQQQQQQSEGPPRGQGVQHMGDGLRQPPAGQVPGSAAAAPAAAGGNMSRQAGTAMPADQSVAAAEAAAGGQSGQFTTDTAHTGKENAASNAQAAPSAATAGPQPAQCQQQQGQQARPAGRSLLSLPKRPTAASSKPAAPSLTAAAVQQQTSGDGQHKRKLAESSTTASKRIICISDSDDDFQ